MLAFTVDSGRRQSEAEVAKKRKESLVGDQLSLSAHDLSTLLITHAKVHCWPPVFVCHCSLWLQIFLHFPPFLYFFKHIFTIYDGNCRPYVFLKKCCDIFFWLRLPVSRQ